MKKVLLLIGCILLLCSCTKNDEESIVLWNTESDKVLYETMESKKEFINEEGKSVFFKDYIIYESDMAIPYKYSFVDLDKDGVEELAILTTSNYGAYIILDYDEDKVYGYMLGARSFEELKQDGTFMGSGGAAVSSYNEINFKNHKANITELALYDGNENRYAIDGNKVSKEEIDIFIDEWNSRKNAIWNDYK